MRIILYKKLVNFVNFVNFVSFTVNSKMLSNIWMCSIHILPIIQFLYIQNVNHYILDRHTVQYIIHHIEYAVHLSLHHMVVDPNPLGLHRLLLNTSIT